MLLACYEEQRVSLLAMPISTHKWINQTSIICFIRKTLLNVCHVSCTLLGTGHIVVSKTERLTSGGFGNGSFHSKGTPIGIGIHLGSREGILCFKHQKSHLILLIQQREFVCLFIHKSGCGSSIMCLNTWILSLSLFCHPWGWPHLKPGSSRGPKEPQLLLGCKLLLCLHPTGKKEHLCPSSHTKCPIILSE